MSATRDELIDTYAVLSDPPGDDLQDLIDLVAHVCDVPTAVINIVTRTHQHQIATAGFEPSVCLREDSMCALVLDSVDAVVVPDASRDARFSANAFVTGEIAEVRFYASAPIITPDGLVLGRLCVFDDTPRELTDRQQRALGTLAHQVMDVLELRHRGKALEESLRELTEVRDELRRSNDYLLHFAGQVSHDLRSPLTVIMTTAEIMAGEPAVEVDEELGSMVESVSRAGQRMNRMIEEMLNLALEGGRLELQQTSVRSVVDLVLADLAPAIAADGATVVVHDLPTLAADPDMLYSIVLNLVTNALKFTRPAEPPRVEIGAEQRAGRWRILVDDAGPGVPEHLRAAVFSPYQRAATDVAGHGIGLATTKRLVEAHDGHCGMDASPAGGARVWFELPG